MKELPLQLEYLCTTVKMFSSDKGDIMRKTLCLLIAAILMLAICSCGNYETDVEVKDNGDYSVYYTNSSNSTLLSLQTDLSSKDADSMVTEMFNKMSSDPAYMEYKSVVPEEIVLSSFRISGSVLSMNFPDTYYKMNNVHEILFRAAVVKTMTQIKGIDYVSFYVSNEPLVDQYGVAVGIMLASDFIDETDTSLNSLTWADVTLYYANESGKSLKPRSISVGYSKNTSIEQIIIEQLIKGPEQDGYYRTIPSTVKLLSVSIKDGICYVNFDSSFMNNMADVSPNVTIYSIVNSLCELSTINKVQISVNGDSSGTFMDSISLKDTFERNLDLLENEDQTKSK